MQGLKADDIKSIIAQIKKIIDAHQDFLMQLDSIMGDGDLGFTMTKAFAAAAAEAAQSAEKIPGKLFMRIGMVIAKAAPSTMGTLVATGFMRGGKVLGETENIGTEELAQFFAAFVNSIMERGKSVPGNKTIIDTIYPAAHALREAADHHASLTHAIHSAMDASTQGLDASTQMKAQHGRAAYYQENSIGKQDGGATVGAYIVEGFYQYIQQPENEF
jgi:phosphoenolpyruvate---glycerone phosphotransferase subunit DhaL